MPKLSERLIQSLHIIVEELLDQKIPAEYYNYLINEYDTLIVNLMDKLTQHFRPDPYRIVEFGCGTNGCMMLLAYAISVILKKPICYYAIDSDDESIETLKVNLSSKLMKFTTCITADASKLDWFKNQNSSKLFDAAVFINPIIEDPYDVFNENKSIYEQMDVKKVDDIFSRAIALRQQYLGFNTLFNKIVGAVLKPDGLILAQVFHETEYIPLMNTLSTITDQLPSKADAIPEDLCLVTQLNPAFTQIQKEIKSFGLGSGSKAVEMPNSNINRKQHPRFIEFKAEALTVKKSEDKPLSEMEKLGFGRGSCAIQYGLHK